MKKLILLLSVITVFNSCSNDDSLKKSAESWVQTNIFPYLENSSIDRELTQVVKIKDQVQCNDITKLLIDSYTKGSIYSMFNRGVSEQDSSLIDLSSRLKIIANTQEKALYYSPDCKSISVSIHYKNKYYGNVYATTSYLVVFNKEGKIMNSGIKSEYNKELKMQLYTTIE